MDHDMYFVYNTNEAHARIAGAMIARGVSNCVVAVREDTDSSGVRIWRAVVKRGKTEVRCGMEAMCLGARGIEYVPGMASLYITIPRSFFGWLFRRRMQDELALACTLEGYFCSDDSCHVAPGFKSVRQWMQRVEPGSRGQIARSERSD